MHTIDSLLAAPGLTQLRLGAGPGGGLDVTQAVVFESSRDLKTAPPGSLAILTRVASTIEDYQLDIAIREASSAGVAAILLVAGNDRPIARSSVRVSERVGVSILLAPTDRDAGTLCIAIQREIDGGAVAWMERLGLLCDELAGLEPNRDSPAAVVGAAERILGRAVSIHDAPDFCPPSYPGALLDRGHVTQILEVGGDHATVAAVVCSSAINRLVEEARRVDEGSLRSASSVFAELILTSSQPPDGTVDRARAMGIDVDGWHLSARLEISDYERYTDNDPVAEHDLRDVLAEFALQTVRQHSHGVWNAVNIEGAVVLVRTNKAGLNEIAIAETIVSVGHALERIQDRYPLLHVAAGLGRVHEGIEGLRVSSSEAAAVAASASRGQIARFDPIGLRGMLVNMTSTHTSRSALRELLAPLEQLGGEKADGAVQTLLAYLETGGSCTRAGEKLFMHRNAVAYRIRGIQALLDKDLRDPENRFALELACRTRLLVGPLDRTSK